ncbi:MAG TPA: Ig-like domain-containing protein, partial [Solirubrobacteraceae bacterium]|nr:Ig-like domain-containing protein [Solirubrobacteraceae bacterium]
SVGWGDQYEATDGGEGIPISSLPNGTYWLQGIVDPNHYFVQSNAANDIIDTKLQIEGETLKVLEQTQPEAPPPSVTLTSPAAGALVSGTTTLSATASAPSAISSVQFLLDGQPIGEPVKAPPYTINWPVGGTTPGQHLLSAQATDAEGFVGTAADVPVTIGAKVGSVSVDANVTATGTSTSTTPSFSTAEPGDVLLAFVDSDGPTAGGQTLSVSGAGLNWSLVKRANTGEGDAEIWTATSVSSLLNATVTARAGDSGYPQSLNVIALSGAAGIGSSATAFANKGAPAISLTSTEAGSVALATGEDPDSAKARTLGSGQELLAQDVLSAGGDTFWTQYATTASSASGQPLTLDDTAPTTDAWNMAAVEVLPVSEQSDTEPPTVSIVNPTANETVSGTAQVSASASDNVGVASVQFYLDGSPLGAPVTKPPFAISWDTTTASNAGHTLTATAADAAGNVGQAAPVSVTVQNPAEEETCFTADITTSVEGARTVTTQPFTTAEAGEQLFAFVSADGPAGAGRQSAKISGGGLAWHLLERANSQSGDAEIWTAEAQTQLVNQEIKSKLARAGYEQQLTVIAMQGSRGAGAVAAGSAPSGESSVTLTTKGAGSLVYAVGSDATSATSRTLGSNQTLMRQELDTAAGKTFWSQFTSDVTGPIGSLVMLNDTAPTADQWNMAAVEVLANEI